MLFGQLLAVNCASPGKARGVCTSFLICLFYVHFCLSYPLDTLKGKSSVGTRDHTPIHTTPVHAAKVMATNNTSEDSPLQWDRAERYAEKLSALKRATASCTWTCMHVCVYVHACVCVPVYKYVLCMCVCLRAIYMHVCLCVHVHTCDYACVCFRHLGCISLGAHEVQFTACSIASNMLGNKLADTKNLWPLRS